MIVELNNISLDDLEKLKEGLSDPSQEIVSVLKKIFSPVATKNGSEDYLVTPFLRNDDFRRT